MSNRVDRNDRLIKIQTASKAVQHFVLLKWSSNSIFACMKFGKLSSIDQVNFSLPPEPAANLRILQEHKIPAESAEKHLFIGATGWGMKEWVGKIYPNGTKAKDYLSHYTRHFNTIELNSTHYGMPNDSTLEKWYEQSSADFKFCPKVLQRISHSRDLSPAGPVNAIRQFCHSIDLLKEKLGPCFIQLPPYFGRDRLPVLKAFLERWDTTAYPLSVEVRHESWFEQPEAILPLIHLLEERQVSTVITDVAGRRDVCHMQLTTDTAVIRFVGNGLVPSDYSRIDEWVNRLDDWFKNGLKNAYFFTHEPDNLLSPELADYLAKKIKAQTTILTRGPELITDSGEGQQMSLF